MAGLGNTITTKIPGYPPVTTTRNAGESDDDFIDRHCRAVLAAVHASGATALSCEQLPVELERIEGESEESFVAAYCAELKAAA